MKKTLTLAFLAVMATNIWADQFSLQHDTSGQIFGPFSTDPGTKVTIGKTTFTLLKSPSAEPDNATLTPPPQGPLTQALIETTIPHAEFRYASPGDCISYIKETVNSQNKSSPPINIVTRGIPNAAFAAGAKTITLELHSTSAFQVLTEICAQADLSMSEANGILVIEPKK